MIHEEPYPFFVIDNFLKKELHANLKRSFPSNKDLLKVGAVSSKNRYNFMRGSCEQAHLINSSSAWKLFDDYIKVNFIKDMLDFVQENFGLNYSSMLENKGLVCHYDISRASSGYSRSCHIDRRHHLMSFLYYVNDQKEYKGEGGDFLVYDVENKQNINEAFDVFPDHSTIRAVKTIRPEENCLIGFVNFQNSYHGVSKMKNNVSDRMFLYISIDSIDKKPIWENENIKVLSEQRRQDFLNE